MIKFIKSWALPIAMFIGSVGHGFFKDYAFISPYFIFLMLLLTFCKISFSDLKLRPVHFLLLAFQLGGSVAAYYLLLPFHELVAQSVLLCIVCPTATAAAVITMRLGGDAASLTTYTLLSNLGTALLVPAFFPLVEPHPGMDFLSAFLLILSKVFPLLICPFLLAALLRRWVRPVHSWLVRYSGSAFYLWAVSVVVVMGQTVHTMLTARIGWQTEALIALSSLLVCILQFAWGKYMGSRFGERISDGQSIGQKNTIFAIWLAHAYLNPLTAIAPGCYMLWQNSYNSWQLWRKECRHTAS